MLHWLWLAWSVAALAVGADSLPPTTPQDLKAVALSAERIQLTWSAAADDVGVVCYDIERNGRLVASVVDHQYLDVELTPNTQYQYRVAAVDILSNFSGWSTAVTLRTPPGKKR